MGSLVLGPVVIKFGLAAPARTPKMSCPGVIMTQSLKGGEAVLSLAFGPSSPSSSLLSFLLPLLRNLRETILDSEGPHSETFVEAMPTPAAPGCEMAPAR